MLSLHSADFSNALIHADNEDSIHSQATKKSATHHSLFSIAKQPSRLYH